MQIPIRVQRKRIKGYKLPPNTVSVTRPGRWGNPFRVDVFGAEMAVKLFEAAMRGVWHPSVLTQFDDDAYDLAYNAFTSFRHRHDFEPLLNARRELRGKNLACYCPLATEWCHADSLLRVANG